MIYVIYDQATGEISRYLSVPATSILSNVAEGEAYLETESFPNSLVEYVSEGVLTPRPTMSLVQSTAGLMTTETLTISGIPPGTLVQYPGGEVMVDDGYIDWSSASEGTFNFRFINFPYQEAVLNATVTAA